MTATLSRPPRRSPAAARPTPEPADPREAGGASAVPRLNTGDHLGREEFHRRYEAMGPGTRAELIEGIVYVWSSPDMPSPVSLDSHGTPHLDVAGWIFLYCAKTPGLVRGDNCSVFADDDNEPQPDVLLGIPESAGGRTRTVMRGRRRYVATVPELIVEVAASTAAIDLNAKRRAYERNGVAEYVVALTDDPAEVRWLARDPADGGRLAPLAPDPADGLLKSRTFPGLWLDAAALLSGDPGGVLAAVERGCATPGHAEFAARLAAGASAESASAESASAESA